MKAYFHLGTHLNCAGTVTFILLPVDLSKLSYALKSNVVKEDAYNAKTKNIEDNIPDVANLPISGKINEFNNKIPNITNLDTSAALDAKVSKVNITNLATAITVLNVLENKIPYVSNLLKKLTITQKSVKLKIKLLLIMNMINILLLKFLIS